jgi:chemotaxis protein methyltransferase CheR
MERALSDSLFQQFSRLVHQQIGINLHEGKRALLQARLNKRLRATGATSYKAYYNHIVSPEGGSELIHFLDCISTNLTYFFREPQHFEFLDHVLMPELLERKKKEGSNRIRVWSAGCSSGEEPFSIAMCALSHLKNLNDWDFRILATDISTRVLRMATAGVYQKEKVQKVPPLLRQQYFREYRGRHDELQYEVIPLLKQIVTFGRLNLKGPYPFKGPFDFLFCRNVMIYFDKVTQETIIKTIADYLSSGGYLFIGHSESLAGLVHPLIYVRPAVYKK